MEEFPVQKGTRQGYPISPPLFIATLEVFLGEIQKDEQFKGMKIKSNKFKYQAFANDIVFFIEDPLQNLPILIKKLEGFGQLAGLYINRDKSKLLLKNIRKEEQVEIQKQSRCVVAQKVRYLGIEITNKNIDLLKNNYIKLWEKIKEDFVKWNQQNLSLLGRIATIKMNILPRILFLFQTIPIIRKRHHFLHWKREITNFIWVGKKPRLKYKILCDAHERGGL